MTEALKFPIGRYEPKPYSEAQRDAWIRDIDLLPGDLEYAILNLDEAQLNTPYRDGGWTVRQLVHHVADSHVNAYIRVKLGLTEVEPTIKPYDQDAWVTLADSTLSPLVSLTMLDATHTRLVAVLRSMTADQFARTINHPENGIMTLDDVAAMYAWHGDHHVRQVENYRAARVRTAHT